MPSGLRLTRRGRRLVAGLCIASVLGLGVVVGGMLDGSNGGFRLAGQSRVVVDRGDTLWSIARSVAPDEDTRAVVDEIERANRLDSTVLVPGQVLELP